MSMGRFLSIVLARTRFEFQSIHDDTEPSNDAKI
jgi:hypothetical protein